MPEPERSAASALLAELCHAIGADGGGALYLDDGDGTLQLSATSGPEHNRGNFLERMRGRSGGADDGRTMLLRLGGGQGGLAVLSRRGEGEFTQQDLAVARLYARRFTEQGVADTIATGRSGWTRQLEAIQRIAARLTRLASVEEVAAAICIEISEVIDHDEAHVLVIDAAGLLQPVAARGASQYRDVAIEPLPDDGPGAVEIGRAVRGGAPMLLNDVDGLGEGRPGPHSMLIVPLLYDGRVSGLICLIADDSRRFDDDDLRLMQILSDQAAIAIENARLLQGRDELVQELSGLLEISETAASAQDEKTLALLLATRVRQLTQTDEAFVARLDEGSTLMRVILRDGGSAGEQTIDVADSPARRQMLRDGRSVIVQADSTEAGLDGEQLRAAGAHSMILLPLNASGRTIGMVELLARRGPRTPTEAAMHACEAMASLAAAGLEKVRVLEKLRRAADMDLVTGVHNHRYLQERLRQEIARSARSHSPLAVLMLDLDKFKPINDRHGHADGDLVLHNIAATIKAHVRTNDIVARYGGDEFIVLMPDTADDQAGQVARRVVSGVLKQIHELSDRSRVNVGVSAGLAVFPADGRTSAQLLAAADTAMYAAKRDGGRQVERSRPGQPSLEPIPAGMGEPMPVRATA